MNNDDKRRRFGKTVALPVDAVVQRITAELALVGFGVLTEIADEVRGLLVLDKV